MSTLHPLIPCAFGSTQRDMLDRSRRSQSSSSVEVVLTDQSQNLYTSTGPSRLAQSTMFLDKAIWQDNRVTPPPYRDPTQEIAPRWIGSCALHPTSPDDLRDDARVEVEVVNTVLMVSKRYSSSSWTHPARVGHRHIGGPSG
jgi:hypothetical protein